MISCSCSQVKYFLVLVATISSDRKKLQEAMFEVITSEASYLKSLNILIWHFAQSPRLIGDPPYVGPGAVLGKRDHRVLFSDVISVGSCFILDKDLADTFAT